MTKRKAADDVGIECDLSGDIAAGGNRLGDLGAEDQAGIAVNIGHIGIDEE